MRINQSIRGEDERLGTRRRKLFEMPRGDIPDNVKTVCPKDDFTSHPRISWPHILLRLRGEDP